MHTALHIKHVFLLEFSETPPYEQVVCAQINNNVEKFWRGVTLKMPRYRNGSICNLATATAVCVRAHGLRLPWPAVVSFHAGRSSFDFMAEDDDFVSNLHYELISQNQVRFRELVEHQII